MAPKTPPEKKRPVGSITAALGHKSNIGKTTVIRCIADLFDLTGRQWTGLSVDRSERLPLRYPNKFIQLNLPTDREGRLDPYAHTRAFGLLDEAIDHTSKAGSDLLIDVGSGEYLRAVLDNAARSRLNPLLTRLGIEFNALIVTTTDSLVMADVPRLADAVLTALPAAKITIILNQRNGTFEFTEGSEEHKVWTDQIQPLLQTYPSVTIPAMAQGCWDHFENQGLRFSQVGLLDLENSEADERQLIAWTRESRSVSVARHGDVAEWLHDSWKALSPLTKFLRSSGNNDA